MIYLVGASCLLGGILLGAVLHREWIFYWGRVRSYRRTPEPLDFTGKP